MCGTSLSLLRGIEHGGTLGDTEGDRVQRYGVRKGTEKQSTPLVVSNSQAKVNEIDGKSIATDRESNMTSLLLTDGIGVPNCERNLTLLTSADFIGVLNCADKVMTV